MITFTVLRIAFFVLGAGMVLTSGIIRQRGRKNRFLLLAGVSLLLLFLFLSVAEMVLSWHISVSAFPPYPAPPVPRQE